MENLSGEIDQYLIEEKEQYCIKYSKYRCQECGASMIPGQQTCPYCGLYYAIDNIEELWRREHINDAHSK